MSLLVRIALLAVLPYAEAATTVPIEIQRGSPVAYAVIGDVELRLIVDSGGRLLGLRPESLAKLDGIRAAGREVSTDVYGAETEGDAFTVPALTLGGSEFRDISGFVWTVPNALANTVPAIDGIIGRDFLNDFLVVYDYPGSKIVLTDRRSEDGAGCRGTTVSLVEHPEGVVVTEVELDGHNLRALWDTGATHSFVKSSVAEAAALELEPIDDRTQMYRSETLKIGSADFGPLGFVALPLVEPEGIDVYIGYNFFAKHVVCIDYRNGELWIRRPHSPGRSSNQEQ